MEYRRLGRTGAMVAPLALGTDNILNPTPEDESSRMIIRALDAGINLIDTSNSYGAGEAERVIGRVLAESGRRDEAVIATKVHYPTGPGPNDRGNSRMHIMRACEQSLRRLQTDRIDLYQLHAWDPRTPIDESLGALDDLVRAGKILYAGCSNFLAYQVARSLGRSETLGLARFDSVQPRYNLLFRQIERELLPLCTEDGIGVIPYNPMAGGFLSGKHRPGAPTESTRFTLGTAADMYKERYWNERAFATVEAIRPLAAEAGMTMAQLAVAWVLAHPAVTAPIIGASRPEQLADSVAALSTPLDAGLKATLDDLTNEYRFGDAAR